MGADSRNFAILELIFLNRLAESADFSESRDNVSFTPIKSGVREETALESMKSTKRRGALEAML